MSNDRLKFRAWDEQKEIMHYDFEFIRSGTEGNDWVVFVSDKQPLNGKPHPLENPHFSQQLKIMQWTGLYDSEGVEIYEGDIVHIEKDRFGPGRHEVWSVEYGYFGDAAFYAHNHLNSGRLLEPAMCSVSTEATFSRGGPDDVIVCKVDGNIYENPDLLDA